MPTNHSVHVFEVCFVDTLQNVDPQGDHGYISACHANVTNHPRRRTLLLGEGVVLHQIFGSRVQHVKQIWDLDPIGSKVL